MCVTVAVHIAFFGSQTCPPATFGPRWPRDTARSIATAGADDRLTNAEGLGAFEMAERGLSYEATLHHGG